MARNLAAHALATAQAFRLSVRLGTDAIRRGFLVAHGVLAAVTGAVLVAIHAVGNRG